MVSPGHGRIAAAVASCKPGQMPRPVLALSWLLLGGLVSAHPGGLDKTGGHTDKKTGQYHRHATTGSRTATPAESAARAEANIVTGRVVVVSDGDTISVLTPAKEQVKVRLYAIDAPEAKQAFGARAKQELSDLVYGKTVTIEVEDKDRYGRTVGRVFADGVDVNLEMVRRRFAWWYRAYAKKDVALAKAEAEAKNAGRGLWADKTPVPPWEFRRSAKVRAGA